MLFTVFVKIFGGLWSVRDLARNAKNRFSKRILKYVYTQYLQSQGAYIALDAEIEGQINLPHKALGIFIAPQASIGSGCTIYQQVTIGENNTPGSKGFGSPTIGANVYVGAGAKIVGNVTIGDDVRIGANAVVVQDVPARSTVVSPASVIISREPATSDLRAEKKLNVGAPDHEIA